jgi:16S rRNA (guanine527-N7)-methyltransferase
LDRLARWCLPLLETGGRLLALKGSSAAEELAEHAAEVGRLGGRDAAVTVCGEGVVEQPTTIVSVIRGKTGKPGGRRAR